MIAYILKSGAIALICLGFYHLVLKKEKMFVFNRLFLLLGLIAAIVIPFLELSFSSGVSTLSNGLARLEYVFIGEQKGTAVVSETVNWGFIIRVAYSCITALLLTRFLYQIFSLIRKARMNEKFNQNGVVLVQTTEEKAPFAFLNYIFIPSSKRLDGSISSVVLAHESAHVHQYHSLDVLFIELIRLVFWFNPVFFYFKKAMQLNHEFLADSAVVGDYKNISEYQDILLNSLTPSHNEFLTSSFNYNVTKHRLKMMNKHTTNRKRTVLAASCAPLFLVMALFFSGHSIAQDSKSTPTNRSINKSYFKDVTFTFKNKKGQDIYTDYAHLSDEMKQTLPPPPPLPNGEKLKPLSKETVVDLNTDGKVFIMNTDQVKVPPPPPPAPPKPEK